MVIQRRLQAFVRRESGAAAMLTAVLLVPVLALLFLGVDAGRAWQIQARTKAAALSAATAAAYAWATTGHCDPSNARDIFRASMPEGLDGELEVDCRDEGGGGRQVQVRARPSLSGLAAAQLGFPSLRVEVVRTVTVPGATVVRPVVPLRSE